MSEIKLQVESKLPTPYGDFRIRAYSESPDDLQPHIAMIKDPIHVEEAVLVRIHSECMTGDLFGSYRCDCGEQLMHSVDVIGENGGVLIYLRQEGRGIGIINKLKAYNLQDDGVDTAEANTHLGFEVDSRSFEDAVYILRSLSIQRIKLLTNNPLKVKAFDKSTIDVVERIPLEIAPHSQNRKYLETKKTVMGHLLRF
jgi:GTP cyclohydrolase II